MLPKVVFHFAKPIARLYNELHLDCAHAKQFRLKFIELIDEYSVAYEVTFFDESFGEFSFVAWFIDNYFYLEPDFIELCQSNDDVITSNTFNLLFETCCENNKSIIFSYE